MQFDPYGQRRFAVCLAEVLRQETGYAQPVGGPYKRHASGSNHIPSKADGMWFDDDPDDRGGRTAAGILQREYDAWRTAMGVPKRDVWLIEDGELTDIYLRQYWQHVHGDALPAGLDLAVMNIGVLCGIGKAVRFLQAALGVTVDGHFGVATQSALAGHDVGDLIADVCESWRKYLRGCPTFWKHGKGWLERVDDIEQKARALAYSVQTEPEADIASPVPSRKAREAEPPSSMAVSKEGNAAIALGGTGGWTVAQDMPQAIATAAASPYGLTPTGIFVALASSPAFWMGVMAIASAAYWWLKRREKLNKGV